MNLLPQDQFKQLCNGLTACEIQEGESLFERGAECNEWIYILQGDVVLEADGIVMDTIKGGTDAARFPVAQHIPRKVTARALTQLRYIQLDYQQLNLMENYRPKASGQSRSKGDWVTKLLKSPVFQRLPASNLQKIVNQFEEIETESGQPIITQGEDGDCLYIIKSGQCVISRKPRPNAKEIKLGELRPGDMVGEDALITGSPRSVNVTMLTDGVVLKLGKEDFLELIAKPVLTKVSFETAYREASQEALWLDVRDPDEYKRAHIKESINVPFFSLRMQLGMLQRNRRYIVVCEDGVTSAAAAFLLLRYGFEATFLDGGMASVPVKSLVGEGVPLEEDIGEEKDNDDVITEIPQPKDEAKERQRELVSHNQEEITARVEEKSDIEEEIQSPTPPPSTQLITEQTLEKQQQEIKKLQFERNALAAEKQQLQDKLKEQAELLQKLKAQNESDKLRQELEWVRAEREKDQEKIQSLQQQIDELEGVIQQYFGTTDVQNVEVRVQSLIAELHEVRDQADKDVEAMQEEVEAMRSEVERLKAELESVKSTSDAPLQAVDKEEPKFLSELTAVEPEQLPLNTVVTQNAAASTNHTSKVGASILWMLVGILLSLSIVGIVFQMESGRRLLAKFIMADSQATMYQKSSVPTQNKREKLGSEANVFEEAESGSALFESEGAGTDETGGEGDLFDSE
ncbi:MAG: hypothetical protein AXA67_09780 [Methylothermaceae bacteria B42]|nr:MAG: hypothetical protein AXA67_09780 [Methylothermaceae bacteria B42]